MLVSSLMQDVHEVTSMTPDQKIEDKSTCYCTHCRSKILGGKFPSFRYKRDAVGGMEAIATSLTTRPCPICAKIGTVVPIDYEIIDLIDAMNRKGFKTEASCAGHRQFFMLQNQSEKASRISTFYIQFRLPENKKSLDWLISQIKAEDFLVCNTSFGYTITKEYEIIPSDKQLQCTIGAIDVNLQSIDYKEKIEEYALHRNQIARTALKKIIDELPNVE